MFYLKWNPKFFYTQKRNIFLWKVYRSFTSVLSILQKSKVANNSITILGYSNDKNIYVYIAKNIIPIDQLILFTRVGMFNKQGSTHKVTLCLQNSLRKLNILN